MLADAGAWIWGAVILFWLITSIVGSLRQAAKRAAQSTETVVTTAEQQPDMQRLQTLARQVTPAQDGGIGTQIVQQIRAARDAARAQALPPMQLPDTVSSARQELAATLRSALDTPAATVQPVRPSFTAGLGPALHAPGGLAFGILAAAVLGPPTALKTEPQEPGGW